MPELVISYFGPTQQPTVVFTYSPTSPKEGQVVSFDASGSTDPDGTITAYEWQFGDGIAFSGDASAMLITHDYASAGSYTVVLTVTDSEGLIHQTVKTITVSSIITDSDRDGVGDNADAFPFDPSEQNVSTHIFEKVSVSVVDSISGAPVNGASVFLQIPSSTDANFSYYMANYAAQLPIVVNGQTNMDGKLTYSLDAGAIGALTMAHAEGMFTDFIVDVRIEHSDYETYQGYRRLSVGEQELSLIYEIQSQDTVPSTGTPPPIRVYVKDSDGEPISGAGVTSTSQPSGQSTLTGTTGSEGYVTFDDVKAGSYIFHASADGYVSNSEVLIASTEEMIEKTILLEEEPKGIPGFPTLALALGIILSLFMLKKVQS